MAAPAWGPRSHAWSLADQALVSASNFLTAVLLARFLGIEGFGAYVVAQTYVLYSNTFQSSLVVAPMMVVVPGEGEPAAQRTMIAGFFGYSLLVIAVTTVVVQFLAWLLGRWSPHVGLGELAPPLAAVMVAFQVQDWMRRALYVRSASRNVFVSDVLAYGAYLSAVAWMGVRDNLSPAGALWTLAATFAASAVATGMWNGLWPDRAAAAMVIRNHWRASRDYLATWQLQWLGSSGVILMGTGVVGQQAAGAIRAAQNLLGPVSVLFQWMDNVIPVRAAVRLRDAGRDAVVAYLGRIAWLGSVALSLFAIAVLLVDEPLMVFLYGEQYRPFAMLVALQALYFLLGHGYRVLAYYHRTLGFTALLVQSSLCWVVLALGCAAATVGAFHERGIMLSLLVGELGGLMYLLWFRHGAGRPTGRSADTATAVTHLMLRRSDGSAHLLIPAKDSTLMNAALGMYVPSRWTGRLYKWSLYRSMPLRRRLGWVESVRTAETWCPGLHHVLAEVPGANAEHFAMLIGAPGPCAKLTLKLMDSAGQPVAYARVAHLPGAVEALRRECAMLATLANSPVSRFVPRLLAHGGLGRSGGYFLLESAGPDEPSPSCLVPSHFLFLCGLLRDESTPWRVAVEQVAAAAANCAAVVELAGVSTSAVELLRRANGPAVGTCIEHGDFVPWNIRVRERSLFVLDWEHARKTGLPWMDALHFTFQWETLVRRRPRRQVLARLQAVFQLKTARRYADMLSGMNGAENLLIAMYLLKALSTGVREGLAAQSQQQRMRHAVLELVLNEM